MLNRNHFLRNCLFLALLVMVQCAASGQTSIDSVLYARYHKAATDSARIISLAGLADYYYANKNYPKADSLIEKQIMMAEALMNPRLILFSYFRNPGYRSVGTNTKDRSQNTRQYIQRAIAYARLNNFTDYAAMGYANLSALSASSGDNESAFRYANEGFAMALNAESDSANIVCAVQLGNTYLLRSDMLMAFRTYTNAANMGMDRTDGSLLPQVYHVISQMYKKLGNQEIARNYIFRSLSINKKNHYVEGQVIDQIALAKLSNYAAGKEYLQEAIRLAGAVYNVALLLESERILFSHMLLHESPAYMLAYLDERRELKNMFEHSGENYLDWMYGEIYYYGGRPDSALVYFKKAESAFSRGYDLTTQKNFFGEYALCLQSLGRDEEAIGYYRRTADLARNASDLPTLQSCAASLRELYRKKNDFETAYQYSVQYEHYKDSLDLLGREKDLALMEITNEEKEQLRLMEVADRELQRKHNLQYMLITLLIAGAFLVMLMIGMFRVSTFMIRLMGFLSLIFFFEFIILILDTKIHHFTHGDPLKVWLIKIGIISLLLPTHHYLEHKLIHYLMSRHLIRLRKKLVPSIFQKKAKVPVQADPESKSPEPGDGPAI